jgi:hypothetical protein
VSAPNTHLSRNALREQRTPDGRWIGGLAVRDQLFVDLNDLQRHMASFRIYGKLLYRQSLSKSCYCQTSLFLEFW